MKDVARWVLLRWRDLDVRACARENHAGNQRSAGGNMSTDYTLAYGTHATPEEGRCAMEWVSHLAGEPHGDQPACVSPVLRAFCVSLNDSLPDVSRQIGRASCRERV